MAISFIIGELLFWIVFVSGCTHSFYTHNYIVTHNSKSKLGQIIALRCVSLALKYFDNNFQFLICTILACFHNNILAFAIFFHKFVQIIIIRPWISWKHPFFQPLYQSMSRKIRTFKSGSFIIHNILLWVWLFQLYPWNSHWV